MFLATRTAADEKEGGGTKRALVEELGRGIGGGLRGLTIDTPSMQE
jgi:hypothetical protein